jgi:hypothetical protein
VLFLVIRGLLIKKEKPLLEYGLFSVFSLTIIALISFSLLDYQEYQSFNNLEAKQIREIKIDGKLVDQKRFDKLFEELKYDEFTWVNHPSVSQKYTIAIRTKKRKYLFLIESTSNQGVLVTRINQRGSDYITNRNDFLLQYLQ